MLRFLTLGCVVLLVAAQSTAAEPSTDTFASSQAPRQCGTAHAACSAARQLESMPNTVAKQAALACVGDLDDAVAYEEQLNGELDHLKALRGQAREDYYKNTVVDTNEQRGRALDAYRECATRARPQTDLRPDDYPKSPTLLQGGVSNVDDSPAAAAAALGATLQKMDDALDPIATPLQNLSNVLDAIAPHYDMVSRSDTGVRVIQGILVDMGLGHLVGKVPAALRAMAGHGDEAATSLSQLTKRAQPAGASRSTKPAQSGKPFGSESGGGQRSGGGSGSPALPPTRVGGWTVPGGVPVPEMLTKTPRPMYLQEQSHSCAQACVRMVTDTVRRMPIREGFLRTKTGKFFEPGEGTDGWAIGQLLEDVGIPNNGWGSASVDTIQTAVRDGYPAIVTYGSNHVSIVDAVVSDGKTRYLFLRNPTNFGPPKKLSSEMINDLGSKNYVVVEEQGFLKSFNAGGSQALFTSPSMLYSP